MNYEQYKQEMDKLERRFDEALSMDDPVAADNYQKQMDRLTARVTAEHDAALRSRLH